MKSTSNTYIQINTLKFLSNTEIPKESATSMLVTDVGDKICWRQVRDVGDGLADFVTDILYLSALALVAIIQKMSPISKFCHQQNCHRKLSSFKDHQHPSLVTNIYVAQKFKSCRPIRISRRQNLRRRYR